MLKHIGSVEEFKETIMNEKAIVMIHKTNCDYCSRALPWMEEFSEEHDVPIAEVNEKDIRPVLDVFQVKSYPTFAAFSKGTVTEVFAGDTKYEKVKAFVEQHA